MKNIKGLIVGLLLNILFLGTANAAVLFSDNFDRADSASLGGDWTVRNSSWGITTNKSQGKTYSPQLNGFSSERESLTTPFSTADYTVEADVITNNWAVEFGIMGRAANCAGDSTASSGYIAMLTDSVLILRAWGTGGTCNNVININVSVTTLINTTYRIKLSMQGTTIKVFLDGVEKISTTDSNITLAGDAGLTTTGSVTTPTGMRWDNFTVNSFSSSGGPTPGPGPTNNQQTQDMFELQ